MSSTQHQLIEQCATRLRGIVEALDNIHDNTPHRWSTDLDEVHSSAESLLALIKDYAPARSDTSFEEWLANELEGEDGQPVPAAVCDIALARRAFNHWPKLEQPARVGGVRFSAGVSSRLVVEAAQRLYEFESTPEKEAERIERLQAFREQLDPLNLAPHAGAFNEAPAEALKPEQAKAERLDWSSALLDVAVLQEALTSRDSDERMKNMDAGDVIRRAFGKLKEIRAQHDRIVGALRAERDGAIKLLGQSVWQKIERLTQERDAAQANVDALAVQVLKLGGTISFAHHRTDQAGQVPQAWLDVQAERKRQVEVEGWTPEHDDAHSHGQIARAAACYALAGSSAPNDGTAALLVSLAWPWDEQWWKPTSARRDMVKACALGLAEIERLDRAAPAEGGDA
ncbi:TPA: hypothetical protein ACGJTN_002771 [Pseudomonas aeruginosa]|uniref:hypothetical protein n=1 Tax=Pseudomonas aeruginosa TaxID=287 RepID=UPI00053D0C78|nr:hypothetical protein [Pseudomonas aeruginosa]